MLSTQMRISGLVDDLSIFRTSSSNFKPENSIIMSRRFVFVSELVLIFPFLDPIEFLGAVEGPIIGHVDEGRELGRHPRFNSLAKSRDILEFVSESPLFGSSTRL